MFKRGTTPIPNEENLPPYPAEDLPPFPTDVEPINNGPSMDDLPPPPPLTLDDETLPDISDLDPPSPPPALAVDEFTGKKTSLTFSKCVSQVL